MKWSGAKGSGTFATRTADQFTVLGVNRESDAEQSQMRYLIESIERAVSGNHLLPGIVAALAVPDVAVAAMQLDGRTSGPRYSAWVDRWFHQHLPHYRESLSLDGTVLYGVRCTLLQQGMGTPARAEARARGNRAVVKRQLCFVTEDVGEQPLDLGGIPTVCIHARRFAEGMAAAGRSWLEQADSATQARLQSLIQVRNRTDALHLEHLVLTVDY